LGLDVITEFTLGDLDVILGDSVGGDEVEEAIFDVNELVFGSADVGHIHVVSGWRDIFVFTRGEDIYADQMNFGVAVFTSLGSGHVDDFAGSTLDDNVSVLTQGGTLHGVSERGTSSGSLEGLVVLLIVRHGGC